MPGKFPSNDLMWGFHQHTDLSSGHVWIQPPFLKEPGWHQRPEWASNLFMFQPQSSKIDFSSIWQLARSLNDLSPCFYAEGFEDLSKEDWCQHWGWCGIDKDGPGHMTLNSKGGSLHSATSLHSSTQLSDQVSVSFKLVSILCVIESRKAPPRYYRVAR